MSTPPAMPLPRALEPWRPWLALLAPELAEPLGQLLLQLDPMVGRMRAAAPSPDALPAGVGSIVQRGSYERLLISEWAVADAEPDEFIRRAAGNELLFTGPEPERQRRSQRCIALFDAGPAQLGEPRLAHLALFILLARRAQEAGAAFEWGVLQHPGALHPDSSGRAMLRLLNARTLLCVEAGDIGAWEGWLEQQRPAGADHAEVWQLGAPGTALLRQALSHVTISPGVLDDRLDLMLHQHRTMRRLALDVPEGPVGVRLLRHPLGDGGATQPRSRIGTPAHLRPSAMQPPRFGAASPYLAAARTGGGIVIYHVPSSSAAPPAPPRRQQHEGKGNLLGVVMLKKSCGTVSADGAQIHFAGFPGLLFREGWVAERPPKEQFLAPPGLGRWLPTFFLAQNSASDTVKRVLMVDLKRRLVCWEWSAGAKPVLHFSVVAQDVVGAAQSRNALVYASAASAGIALYRWPAHEAKPVSIETFTIEGGCSRVCFSGKAWDQSRFYGTLAWERDDGAWELFRASDRGVAVPEGASVIGVATIPAEAYGHDVHEGLVVLAGDKRSIRLCTGTDSIALVRSEMAIAQASLDPRGERLAWIVDGSRELCVRDLRKGQLLLRAVSEGDADAA